MAKKKKLKGKSKEAALIDSLANDLGKRFGITIMDEDTPDQVPYYTDFQHLGLQTITGGIPGGRFIQIEGDSQCGKSYLLYEIMAGFLAEKGQVLLNDPEIAYEAEYGARVGITGGKRFLYSKNKSLEKFFDMSKLFIKSVRSTDKTCPILVGLDSYPPLLPNLTLKEMDNVKDERELKGYIHAKKNNILAVKLGEFVPFCDEMDATFIMINQTRIKMGVTFGDPRTSNAENVIKYYCTLRLRGNLSGKIKNKAKTKIIGVNSTWETIKNRKKYPFKKIETEIIYATGIEPHSGLYKMLIAEGILKKCKVGKFNGFKYKGKKYKKAEMQKFIEKHPGVLKKVT